MTFFWCKIWVIIVSKSAKFLVLLFFWMRNKRLLLSIFCTFQTPSTLLTNFALNSLLFVLYLFLYLYLCLCWYLYLYFSPIITVACCPLSANEEIKDGRDFNHVAKLMLISAICIFSFLQFVYFQASFLQFVVGIKTISISGVLILWFYGNLCNKEKIIQLVAHVIQQSIELSILEACSACLSCHLHSSGQSGTLPRCWPGRMLHIKACCNLVLIKVSSNLTHHCLLLVCFQFFNLSYHLTNTIVFHLSEVKAWIHSPLQSLSSHPGGSLSTWEKKPRYFIKLNLTPWRGWLNT